MPPRHRQKPLDATFVEAFTDRLERTAADDCLRFDISCHQGAGAYHCTVSDVDAGHDNGFGTHPDIIADHRVPSGFVAVLCACERRLFGHPIEGKVLIRAFLCPWLPAIMNAAPEPIEQKLPIISWSAPSS